MPLNSISEAIQDIKDGKIIIVVDDENRENEGDFVCAAEKITPEIINFMATYGRGLICTPLLESRCKELGLNQMVTNNTESHQTKFTVSVDVIGRGTTTGISAYDRSETIKALVESETKPSDLARPGHIFPLQAMEGGVLRRTGHTEAAVDLARLAGLYPAGVIVEILNEDGTMARLPKLQEIAKKYDLKIISIEDLVSYRMKLDSLVERVDSFPINSPYGNFVFHAFNQTNNNQFHFALTKGEWIADEPIPLKVKSMNNHNDLIAFMTGDHLKSVQNILDFIQKEGKGCVIFMNQEIDTNKAYQRIKEYKKYQEKGEVNNPLMMSDNRDFGIGAQIIAQLGIKNIRIITDKPVKRVGIEGYGIKIVDNINLK